MILRSLWFRPLFARPLRFLATVLGVAIGVTSVVSTVLASRAAVASLGADVEEIAGAAALEIRRPGGVDVADLEHVRELAGQALVVPVIEDVAHLPALGDLARVLGVDLLVDGELRALELETPDGDTAAAVDAMLLENGAALSERLAAELGLEPGDPLEAIVDSRPVTLRVAAIFRPERFASAWDRVILVDVALAQEVFARPLLDRVELRPRGDADVDALAAALAARLPEAYRVGPASVRREEGERMVRALQFNLTALSGVSLLVGIVLVATTLATSIVQRKQAIALMRSLGASRGQLASAVMAEAGAIGVLGGGLGVLLGWGAATASLASVRATVATVTPGALAGAVELESRWILLGVGVGLVASLCAALLPLGEAIGVPPIQGLRRERPESLALRVRRRPFVIAAALGLGAFVFAQLPPLVDRPIWALASALLLLSLLIVLAGPLVDLAARARLGSMKGGLGTALHIAQGALAAGRRRAAWAAGAVGVAVGLAVAMTTMIGSFRQSVVEWTEETMRSDLFVRPLLTAGGTTAGSLAPEVAEVAREVFGDEAVDAYHSSEAYVDGQRIELAGADFDVVATEGGVPFLDGRPSRDVFAAALAAGGAVVNEPFARRFDVERGDRIALATPAGTLEREVVGVYRDYSGHTGRVVLDRADYLAAYPEHTLQSLAIFLPEGTAALDARQAFTSALGGRFALDVLLNAEVRGEVLEVFERTFAVTIALQFLAVAVAAIAVVTVLGSLVSERRRDLAIVRVLGGSPVQVAGIVLGKALFLGLVGALGGLLVGLLVGWVLVAVVNVQSFGWTLRFVPPWGSLAATVGLVVPACLLAGLVPAIVAIRNRTQRGQLRESY